MADITLQIASDIHTEFHSDGGDAILQHIHSAVPEILVCAGDIGNARNLRSALLKLCTQYNDAQVIYVPGNHDYYHGRFPEVREKLRIVKEMCGNFHPLNNKIATLHGRRFLGTTLWFRREAHNKFYASMMSDFSLIHNLERWVYTQNTRSMTFLHDNLQKGDIVVTHHLPSSRSTPSRYKNSNLNRFFVCNMTSLIEERKPALWIHGHTHGFCDYMIGETRVVCNPVGYPGEKQVDKPYQDRFMIDIEGSYE